MSLLVVAPTRREAKAIGDDCVALGGGQEAAAELRRLLAEGPAPDAIVIAGVCGGLDPSLPAGSLILAREVEAPNHGALRPDQAQFNAAQRALRHSDTTFVSSRLLTARRPVGGKRRKRELWNVYGTGGVDMETFPIAQAAHDARIPWLALRAVIDPAATSLPAALRRWRTEADEHRLIREIATHPLDWPAYARLGLNLRRALHRLRHATAIVARAAHDTVPLEDDLLATAPHPDR